VTPTRESTELAGKTDAQLVKEAKAMLREAETGEKAVWGLTMAISTAKWGVADRIVALREHGWTQKRIGDALDMPSSTVSQYEKISRSHLEISERPSFADALYATKDVGYGTTERRSAARVLRDRPIEQVEEIVRELPRERQVALARTLTPGTLGDALAEKAEAEKELGPAWAAAQEAGRRATEAGNRTVKRRTEEAFQDIKDAAADDGEEDFEDVVEGIEDADRRRPVRDLLYYLTMARYRVARLTREAEQIDPTDTERQALTERVEELAMAVSWLETVIKGGQRDFDAALAELLREADEAGAS
jgi:transcriptional regulator with XRE-family HTH domain